MNEDISIQEVGAGLVEHARETEFSARGVLLDLFPYVYAASKRLSTRAISRWLQEAHGIKLSAVSISKALRNPDPYWEAIADKIERVARAVETVTNVAVESFLWDSDVFQHLVTANNSGLEFNCAERDLEHAIRLHENNVEFLKTLWWATMDAEAREACWKYLAGEEEAEPEDGNVGS